MISISSARLSKCGFADFFSLWKFSVIFGSILGIMKG